MKERLQSWALWLALASLAVFVVLTVTGVDIGGPVTSLMTLLLPVLVAFGIINDPTVRGQLFSDEGQKWYQSWAVWLSLAALVTYCVKMIFHLDIDATVDGLMNVLLPVLMAFGIVNNPTNPSGL